MIIELSGKGIVCDIFYVASAEFDRIANEHSKIGIEAQIRECCDEHIAISRGFFFDGNHKTRLRFPHHEFLIVGRDQRSVEFEESWRKALVDTHPFFKSDDWHEILGIHPDVVFPDPTQDQVAIVACTEFEDGLSETRIEYLLDQLPDDFRIKCFDVDSNGFVGEVSYGNAIVGTEEYGYAESAIMAFCVDGKETEVTPPSFSQFRTREWLYRYDPELGKHSMDFFGSKGLGWRDGAGESGFVVLHSNVVVCDDENIRAVVTEELEIQGESANLNHLDISGVTDLSGLFSSTRFNGDISAWDVSNVRDMSGMFDGASFEGDLASWQISPDCNTENMFDDLFSEEFRPKTATPLETLSDNSIPIDYDLDSKLSRAISDYLNKQDLDWIKTNQEIIRKLITSHSHLRDLLAEGPIELEVPEFNLENVDRDTCLLLSMFLEAYGVGGYDPDRLSQITLGGAVEIKTLALGHENLFNSVHKAFCLHFDVLAEVSSDHSASFSEMNNPNLIDAMCFVEEILKDPDASFKQQ